MLPKVCATGAKTNKINESLWINYKVNRYRFCYLLSQHQRGKLPPPACCSNHRRFYIDQCDNFYGITVFIFSFHEVCRRIYCRKFSLGECASEAVKRDFCPSNYLPKMTILNMVIPILMHCSFCSNLSFVSCMKPHFIQLCVTYYNPTLRYKSKCIN